MTSERTSFFKKSENREQGYRFLVYLGIVFYLTGIFIEGFKLGGYEPRCAVNGLIILLLGHFFKYQSRSICVLAIIYSFSGVVASLLNLRGHYVNEWGMGVVTLLLILSITALIVVSKHHRHVNSKVIWKHALQKSFLSLIYASIVLFGLVYWITCWVDTLGNIGRYDLMFFNFYLILIFIPIVLAFKGWLPFTKNKPLVYLADQSRSEIPIPKIQNQTQKDELLRHAVVSASEGSTYYNRIGGWLLLPAFGLVITFFWDLCHYYYVFDIIIYPMYNQPSQAVFAPVDMIEKAESFGRLVAVATNAIFPLLYLIFELFLIICFFRKKKITSKLMVAYYFINFLSAIASLGIVALGVLFEPIDTSRRDITIAKLGIALLSLIIFGSYFIFSKRVKNTFIN